MPQQQPGTWYLPSTIMLHSWYLCWLQPLTWIAWKFEMNSSSEMEARLSSGMLVSSWCSLSSSGFFSSRASPWLECFIDRSTKSVTCEIRFIFRSQNVVILKTYRSFIKIHLKEYFKGKYFVYKRPYLESIMPEFIKYLVDNSCIASSPAFQAMSEKTIFVAQNKIAVNGGQASTWSIFSTVSWAFWLKTESWTCFPE